MKNFCFRKHSTEKQQISKNTVMKNRERSASENLSFLVLHS